MKDIAIIPTRQLRNKITGLSTHLTKRIRKGPAVRGMSLMLQEEERKRRMDYVPDVSAVETDEINSDKETLDMLGALGMSDIAGRTRVEPKEVSPLQGFKKRL